MPVEEVLSFALDRYNAYPSEQVALFVHLDCADLPAGYSVQIALPALLQLETYRISRNRLNNSGDEQSVTIIEREEDILLVWQWDKTRMGQEGELVATTRVRQDTPTGSVGTVYLSAQAALIDPSGEAVLLLGQRVYVRQISQSMRYLPEIYRASDFTNRYLMLFESFWRPTVERINASDAYFDPHLTPPSFLPWLGSWFGLSLEEDLPEERKRSLLAQIAPIYAGRGTRQSLVAFLQLYTGGEVRVKEHINDTFVLGNDTRLGYAIALGDHDAKNRVTPQSFDVFIKVPERAVPYESSNRSVGTGSVGTGSDREQARQRYRRRLEALISSFRPAHAIFTLQIEYL